MKYPGYTCKFRTLFHTSNKSEFMAEGAYRFKNNKDNSCVYVACRARGKFDQDGKLDGTLEWIGPIEVDKFKMSSIAFVFRDIIPDEK